MYSYTDQWGVHTHEVSQPGRAYDPNKKITCNACVARLDEILGAWLDTLTKRENLPEGFWNGYKFPWSN